MRDESAEDVRLVLEPKSRNVEPEVLMESLFRLSELETRFPVNMNVLDARGSPGVLSLSDALQACLDHRREVLVRRARFRLQKIEPRLHILDGLLIAFLNLDEVIRIVRYEDEPKAKLIERFKLTEMQADAILNLRLRPSRSWRRWRSGRARRLSEERALKSLLKSDEVQWERITDEVKATREAYSKKPTGPPPHTLRRRPPHRSRSRQAMIEKEPITVILSEKGWIRAMKGHRTTPRS